MIDKGGDGTNPSQTISSGGDRVHSVHVLLLYILTERSIVHFRNAPEYVRNYRASTCLVEVCRTFLVYRNTTPLRSESTCRAQASHLAIFVVLVLTATLAWSGRYLVIDQPRKADVIVVLLGDHNDRRFYRGLELLRADGLPVTGKISHKSWLKPLF
jgi:hypothetical protein